MNVASTGIKKNNAASVRQRLLNLARQDKRPFNELLQYYAMERFLFRLSQSAYVEQFILKGALMLRVWQSPEIRPTMDIDMLGKTDNDAEAILAQMRDIINVSVEDDGLVFNSDSLKTEAITQDADYRGIRVRCRAELNNAQITLQIDIGFGDVIHPKPEKASLPTVLDFPAPELLCYSRESAIAEKFEAMVKLGELNSRMKDFYDIWLLSIQFDFNGADLSKAIHSTFKQRSTPLNENSLLFNDDFIQAKQIQWAAFCKRLQQPHLPEKFEYIVEALQGFLAPILSGKSAGINQYWPAAGPWTKN